MLLRIPTPNLWPAARKGQRLLLNARLRETTVDGHNMVFLERGHPGAGNPTVVLIHGFAAMKENWWLWLQKLPRHWHILAPDLPGFGESDYRPEALYRYESQAKRLGEWLAGFDTANLHLVGSSMGGAIAAVLAHSPGATPRSLTLMNSAGIPEHTSVDIHGSVESDRDDILIPRDWKGVYRMFNSVGSGKPTVSGLAMAGLLGPDLLGRTEALRHIFRDMVADGLAPARYLSPQSPPLQVQWGDKDEITPTRCLDWLSAATPQAEVHLFRDVGHLPMLETLQRSARALIHFVGRHKL